jgi:hypothetical protein
MDNNILQVAVDNESNFSFDVDVNKNGNGSHFWHRSVWKPSKDKIKKLNSYICIHIYKINQKQNNNLKRMTVPCKNNNYALLLASIFNNDSVSISKKFSMQGFSTLGIDILT